MDYISSDLEKNHEAKSPSQCKHIFAYDSMVDSFFFFS